MLWIDIGAFCGYKRKMVVAESSLQGLVTVAVPCLPFCQNMTNGFRLFAILEDSAKDMVQPLCPTKTMQRRNWITNGDSGWKESRIGGTCTLNVQRVH